MGAWPYVFYDYMPSIDPEIYLCPAATKPYDEGGRPPYACWSHTTDDVTVYGSYTVNYWAAREPGDPKFWGSPSMKGAAYVPLLMDGNWKDSEPEPDDEAPPYSTYWWEPNRNEMKRVCIARHGTFVNANFMDFSAKKVGLKELWTTKWHRQWPNDCSNIPPAGGWPEWMADIPEPCP
jgi:hypothetical protein